MTRNHLPHRTLSLLITLLLPFLANGQTASANASQPDPETMLEAYGWFLAQNTASLELSKAEQQAFLRGVQAALSGGEGPENPAAISAQLQPFLQQRFREVLANKSNQLFAKLDQDSAVKQSGSGLYYEIIEAGSEERAGEDDSVKVHFSGEIVDGRAFADTTGSDAPTLPVSGYMKGFGEGVQMIGPGGKIKLYIPGDLGFGPNPPRGSGIPPDATLIMDVELIEINPEG